MAGIAIVSTPSTTTTSAPTTPTTPSTSLFASPNENKAPKTICLMARASTVTSSSPKSPLSPTSTLSEDMDSLEVKKEIIAFDEFLSNMEGDTRVHVESLMGQLGEAQDLLEEKEDEIAKL